jgi:hypothetical protein
MYLQVVKIEVRKKLLKNNQQYINQWKFSGLFMIHLLFPPAIPPHEFLRHFPGH